MAGVLSVSGSSGSSPQRILNVFSVNPLQALRVSDLEFLLLELDGLNDIDTLRRGLVVSSNLVVHLVDSALHGNISVLLEHVVNAGVRAVLQENTEVLGNGFGLLVDFLNLENFAVAALQLVIALVKLPETGSGDGFVGGDDLDNNDGGVSVLVSGESTAEDEELTSTVAAGMGDGSGVGFHK